MKNYREDIAVKAAAEKVRSEQIAIGNAENRLAGLRQEAEESNTNALRIEAQASIGDLTPNEAAEAVAESDAFEKQISETEREIERRKLALGMLKGKHRRAEIAAQDAIRAELSKTHTEGIQRLLEKMSDAQEALNILLETEKKFEPNKLRSPAITLRSSTDISLTGAGHVRHTSREFLSIAKMAGLDRKAS